MARPRRKVPHLALARRYIAQHFPELRDAPLQVHQLDGPPDAPRFAVTAELCTASACPHHITREDAANGRCDVATCSLRHTVRLLFDQDGSVVQMTRSDLHWR
jgi:hypothetical protein